MRAVGREVCDGVDVDVDIGWSTLKAGDQRYGDKRPMAKAMWETIEDVLRAIGALPKKNAA
jgi:hypothetical protein